jgi:hypothetical protein
MTLAINLRSWLSRRQFQPMIKTRFAQPRRTFPICKRPDGMARHCFAGP